MRAFFNPGRLVSAAAAASFVAAVAPMAFAQSVALPLAGTVIPRVPLPQRATLMKPNWINRADCIADEQLTFAIGLSNFAGYALEVWAGAATCSDQISRIGSSAACWLVFRQTPPASLTNNTLNVTIGARDIVGQQLYFTGDPPSVPVAPASVCDDQDQPGSPLFLDFMLVQGTTQAGTIGEWTDMGYDIVPPDPPTGVMAGVGDTRLHLSWTLSTASDLYQYVFYCQASADSLAPRYVEGGPGSPLATLLDAGKGMGSGAGLTDASAVDAAIRDASLESGAGGTSGVIATGTGGTQTTSTGGTGTSTVGLDGSLTFTEDGGPAQVCAATNLIPGSDPVTNNYSQYQRGTVTGINATSGTATGLTNDTLYVCAVSGVDALGNVGVLSNTACATPVALTDFFELYKRDGGKGGGFCSISGQKRDPSGYVAAALALSALWYSRRKRNIA
jgi:hypothetical protein